jgi:glycosyltransferase involved in cell wall biosynthesis
MGLKVIQTVGWYFPDSFGGTEVYVSSLAHELQKQGIDSMIAAPLRALSGDRYVHEGMPVYRYPVFPDATFEQESGYMPHGGFDQFEKWLASQKADLYHQQSLTLGCGLDHLRAAKRLGLKTVLTLHISGSVCLRGSLMRHGREICDGRIDTVRCSACWATNRGVPRVIAEAAARVPLAMSARAVPHIEKARLATVLATPALVSRHKSRLEEIMTLSDRVVVPCEWLFKTLVINGVNPKKLLLCRQGLSLSIPLKARAPRPKGSPLRIGFVGRTSPFKGIDTLIRAVRALPAQKPVELILYTVATNGEQQACAASLRAMSGGDSRIHWASPLPREKIVESLQKLDVLAVPSRVLETGPLVVLEAFMAGVPVIGSNLGGIAELVTDGVNGALLPANDAAAWSAMIGRVAGDGALLDTWRRGIGPVRTMAQVAAEMKSLYQDVAA